jgi:hypothetical protein
MWALLPLLGGAGRRVVPDVHGMSRHHAACPSIRIRRATAFTLAAAFVLAAFSPADAFARNASQKADTAATKANKAAAAKQSGSMNALASHRVGLVVARVPNAGTTFRWTARGAAHVWCSLDHGPAGPCASPKSFSGLQAGRHSFAVSAWNKRVRKSVRVSWTAGIPVPNRAPTLSTLSIARSSSAGSLGLALVSAPPATTTSNTATFAWTADKADRVWCSLDDGTGGPCTSPTVITGLEAGPHSFVVSAWNNQARRSVKAFWTVTGSGSPAPGSGSSASPAPSLSTPSTTPATTTTTSTGTVREAAPGQVAAAVAASNSGDTVICTGGAQPKLTLSKSFDAPGITIKCGSGSYFQGVDTNGQSGYTFDAVESRLPVEVNDYNITPFYLHGTSERIKLTGAFKLSGGYDAIKVYGGCKDCVIDDGGAASDVTGFGGDGIHLNGFTNMRIVSVRIHDPYNGNTPEHNDGIHAQAGTGLYIGPGVRLSATNGPRSDVDSAGLFINSEGGLSNVEIDGVKIQSWQIGRGMQLLGVNGAAIIRNPVVTDCGIAGQSPPITLDAATGGHIDLYGVSKAAVYFNSAAGERATVFH